MPNAVKTETTILTRVGIVQIAANLDSTGATLSVNPARESRSAWSDQYPVSLEGISAEELRAISATCSTVAALLDLRPSCDASRRVVIGGDDD